jgi:hypothetical protein
MVNQRNKPKTGFDVKNVPSEATVHKNLNFNVLMITEDKLLLRLYTFKSALASQLKWSIPTTILITIIITLTTSDFKHKLLLTPEQWQSVFQAGLVLSIIWLFWTLINVVRFWKKANVDNLIKDLRQSSDNIESKKN